MENDRWLSLKEICDYLGVSRDTVLNWIKVKGMPSCKMGKFWKFKKEDVDIWVKSGESAIEKKEEFTK